MRLELTGRHVEVTPALRRVVDAKLARIERLLQSNALSAQVVLTRERTGTRADVTLHARGEKFLHAVGKGTGWPASMAQAVERLVQQVQTVKGKWQERKRTGPKTPPPLEPLAGGAPRGGTPQPAPRVRMPRILRASRQAVKAMSLSEAARQLDSDNGIIVFRDVETLLVSVLYRGRGGELTLVETEP
ncbi:MAG: ribosome-associated translation inhibitor RaiA [Acidobacteria bacterium]|nr:MAG: ribosome-associated translation inhibitor RaiA [Acidobacteriota bacterium]